MMELRRRYKFDVGQKFGPAPQETGRKLPHRLCVLARDPQLSTTNNKDGIMMDQSAKEYLNGVVKGAQKMHATMSKMFALLSNLGF
jgi:hypothetical protein